MRQYKPTMDYILVCISFKKNMIILTESKTTTRELDKIEVIATGPDVKTVKVGDSILIDPNVMANAKEMSEILKREAPETSVIQVREHQVMGIFPS